MKFLKSLLLLTFPELLKFSSIRSVCLLAFCALLTILSACTSADDSSRSSDTIFTVELNETALTETETSNPLTIITTASATLSATLAACANFSDITFTVTDPDTGYTAALDSTASSAYNYDDPNANTNTIDVIITDTELDTELDTEAARIPITVTLQGCYRVEISSSDLTSDTDPLIVSSDQTSTPAATLAACKSFPDSTSFTVTTEPTTTTGYTVAFASSASSAYNYDILSENTQTINVIITRTSDSAEVASIPITVTLQGCFAVTISSSDLTSDTDPLIVSSDQTSTPTATLAACATFSAITFTVTDPATGYTAAFDSIASSAYNYDDPNANTNTIDVIITRTSDSADVASIPITVTLQACYRVTISSNDLTPDSLTVSSGQTATPTATLAACATFSAITFTVTDPATGYTAAFDSIASSAYNYDDPNANTNTIDVIITRTSDSADVASIPITVTLQACYRVTISSNDLTPDSLTVSSGQTATPTATLAACADFSDITFTFTEPTTSYTAALDSAASSVYNYDDPSANANTKTIDVIITRTSDSADVASIPITVTLAACMTFSVEIAGSTELSNGGTSVSDTPVTVTTGNTPTAFTLAACADFSPITFTVTPADYTAALVGNPYYSTANTMISADIVITAAGQSTSAATITIQIQLNNCSLDGNNFADGDGTSATTAWKINNDLRLDLMSRLVTSSSSYRDDYYKVTADIDLGQTSAPWAENTGGSGFTPIGSDSAKFTGNMDCADHTISNLYINRSSEDDIGLFGVITNNAIVANCTLSDAKVTANNSVGGIVGYQANGTISDNTVSNATITATNDDAGGIVGYQVNGTISNNTVSGSSIKASNDDAGGIVGFQDNGTNSSNTVSGDSSITATNNAGGIVGKQDDGTNSDNTVSGGAITATSYAGGIAGTQNDGTISSNSVSGGAITATTNYAGGIVGWQLDGTISDNTVSGGAITATNYAGGIVGKQDNGTNSDNTVSNATITATNNYAGGIAGTQNDGTISSNSVSNSIITATSFNVGGIAGQQQGRGTISFNSVSNATITADNEAGGIVGFQDSGTISNNTVSGSSIKASNDDAGGIVGYQDSGTISSNTVSGASSITATNSAGGIVGFQDNGTVSDNTVSGNSSITTTNSAGGIAGTQYAGTISNNTVSGASSITATNNYAGGIVGIQYAGTISHNFSAALVRASSDLSGGLAAYANDTLSNNAFIGVVCTDATSGTASGGVSSIASSPSLTLSNSYTAAKVTGNTSYGLVPSGRTVSTSYWDNTLNSSTSGEGTGQSTADLQTPTSTTGIYSSWSSTVWDFGTSSDYPALNGLTLTPAEQRTAGATALARSCP